MTVPPEDDSFLASITDAEEIEPDSENYDEADANDSAATTKAPRRKRNRVLLITLATFVTLVIVSGAIFVGLALNQISKVFKGNPLNALSSILGISSSPLKTDAYGNTNMLVFGTTETDPGHNVANSLTDSIMVVSINQKRNDAEMFSVPRDLWVTYPTAGCAAGTQGKINAVYACGLNNDNGTLRGNEDAGQTALVNVINRVLHINIQYVAHVNTTVVRDAVNAVGGITILIHSSDPRGIYDTNFIHRCTDGSCVVKYPNGEVHLSGNQAMWLSQARNDGEGYGLPRGDFDREMYQREMAVAVEQKAKAGSFLANPINVLELLDALGSNVKTNIPSDVIGSFINVARKLPQKKIYSIDFDTQGLYTTGMYQQASIVRPAAGLSDYSALQAFTKKLLTGWLPPTTAATNK